MIESSPGLHGECVAFTGTLASMTHQRAAEYVVDHGGETMSHVSARTTMLVIGEEGWPLESDGRPSQKLAKAIEFVRDGADIRVLGESDWLRLIGEGERDADIRRTYTPAMLSQLLGIPVGVIRRWERLGLIRPVKRVCRLPYFDYQEVTGVRRLAELLTAGVSHNELETSLLAIRDAIGTVDCPLAQLDILVQDAHVVYRDSRGLVQPVTGQRLFEFDPPDDDCPEDANDIHPLPGVLDRDNQPETGMSPAQWFAEACRLAEHNDQLEAAASACRRCLKALDFRDRSSLVMEPDDRGFGRADAPQPGIVNFHLAELLYRMGNLEGAVERYHVAIECDPGHVEAWTLLGCVLIEIQQFDTAEDALNTALALHPDCPDAHFHLASLLDRVDRQQEAVTHWKQYLEFDVRGPWAENARQRLDAATTDNGD